MSDIKKIRNIRKAEKSSKAIERAQINVSVAEVAEENFIKNGEPYQCNGHFSEDFSNLCRQNDLRYIPLVIQRPKRPNSPSFYDSSNKPRLVKKQSENSQSLSQSFIQGGNQSSMQVEPMYTQQRQFSIEMENIPEIDQEFNPKTFTIIKDQYEFFKPKIQVEIENVDKQENLTDIYIRSWKVDDKIMLILQDCLVLLDKLTTLNLFNCGLTERSVDILSNFLPKCANLKNLVLDGNIVQHEPFYKLLSDNSVIQSLSLRNCGIRDYGAELIAYSIGNMIRANTKLLSINLSGNFITDKGAIEISKSLRTNRTLLVLNLSGNEIGDVGAEKLAETLSRFQLTHEEIVRRRMQKAEKLIKEAKLNSPISSSRNKKDGERPPSHGVSSVMSRDRLLIKDKTLKKEKSDHSITSVAPFSRDRSKSKEATLYGRDSSLEKVSNIARNRTNDNKSVTTPLSKKGSITNDKNLKQLKSRSSKRNLKDHELSESSLAASVNDLDILMDDVEHMNGDLWMPGNRTLISLNLSRNKITKFSVLKFLLCVQYQSTLVAMNKAQGCGLLRLNLDRNDFSSDYDPYIQLMDLIKLKDPILNRPVEVDYSIGSGRDTRAKGGSRH